MEDDVVVCRCEEVDAGEIRGAIAAGAHSLAGIARRTRAGMGLCQGKTCRCLLTGILAAQTGREPATIEPRTERPPVRPLSMQIWVKETE